MRALCAPSESLLHPHPPSAGTSCIILQLTPTSQPRLRPVAVQGPEEERRVGSCSLELYRCLFPAFRQRVYLAEILRTDDAPILRAGGCRLVASAEDAAGGLRQQIRGAMPLCGWYARSPCALRRQGIARVWDSAEAPPGRACAAASAGLVASARVSRDECERPSPPATGQGSGRAGGARVCMRVLVFLDWGRICSAWPRRCGVSGSRSRETQRRPAAAHKMASSPRRPHEKAIPRASRRTRGPAQRKLHVRRTLTDPRLQLDHLMRTVLPFYQTGLISSSVPTDSRVMPVEHGTRGYATVSRNLGECLVFGGSARAKGDTNKSAV
ncbi:hypothetical protein FB451DRAFT_1187691 [Mycena latifolia]|nr:hypothetical protein FB451DRAFT_1187691 [Mycena latifolia]